MVEKLASYTVWEDSVLFLASSDWNAVATIISEEVETSTFRKQLKSFYPAI